jgi:hypothetical protein
MTLKQYHIMALDTLPVDDQPIAISLQGLANREEPSIYLLPSSDGQERHWVEWYRQYGYEPVESTLDDLLQAFASKLKGYVVYDPAVPDSLNVAASLAGIMDSVVCAPSSVDRMKALGLACSMDLRGKFTGRVDAYRWLVDNYLDDFDLRVMANWNQGDAAHVHADMDFIIAHRGLGMGCSVNGADYPDEAAIWDKAQTAAPDGAIMIGWMTPRDSEATHVYFASQHSVRLYCGCSWNSSFHQHIAASEPYAQEHCEWAKCDPGARYATITLSDGDSWHSMADVQKKFWLHPKRGDVPLGWEVAPIFAEVGPALLEYYYKTRTDNDYLLCGPSGIAYNYLSGYANWQSYLRASAEIMRKTSLATIWAINRIVRHVPGGGIEHQLKDGPIVYTRQEMEGFGGTKDEHGADIVDPQVIDRYMEYMPDALGFFQGWERIPGEKPYWVGGRLWSPVGALVRKDIEGAIREFEESAAGQGQPAFVSAHVNCYDCDMDTVIETIRRLEDKGFTVVRPDVFLRLAQDARARGLV